MEAERWRDLEGSERLGGGDDGRGGRVLLADPERARKSDIRPKERKSCFAAWEGESGTELEERVRGKKEEL